MTRPAVELELERGDRRILLVVACFALGTGLLAAATSPLIPLGVLVGLGVLGLICWRPVLGLWLFVAIVAVLPFGVIPVPLAGAQLTLVDATLIATFVAVLVRWAFGGVKLPFDAPAVALIGFVLVASAAFLAGANTSAVTPEVIRRTGKLIASLLFFLVARGLLSDEQRVATLARGLMLAGAVQGAIAAGLMASAPLTQLSVLTRLQVIGYPSNDILRYVPGPNNTYTSQLRAIGTSVDPNVLGGTLMLALILVVVQWASPRPVFRKRTLVALALPTAAGVLLSLSRASWLGLAVGCLFLGVIRYRRILVLGLLLGLGVLATPFGQTFISRFVGGFSTADPATAFRLGEYTNALTLLSRYPLLGIGFGASPDIDVTAGVSSVYLLVGEQTGLVGLTVYVVALLSTWLIGVRGLLEVRDQRLQGLRAAFLASLSGALATGLLDHYFANQAFPHAVALFWLYAAGLMATSRSVGVPLGQREPERAAHVRPAALGAHGPAV